MGGEVVRWVTGRAEGRSDIYPLGSVPVGSMVQAPAGGSMLRDLIREKLRQRQSSNISKVTLRG